MKPNSLSVLLLPLPLSMILSKKTNAHKLLPTQWVKNLESLAFFVFGSSIERKVGLYQKYLSERDPKYLKWAIHTLATFNEDMAAYPSVSFSNSNSSFQMSATNSASIWTYNWTVTDTLNETVNVSVEGQDLLGNTYTGTNTLSYVVDNTVPIIIFSDDQTDSYLRSEDTVIIEATFSETLGSTPTLILSDGNLNNTVATVSYTHLTLPTNREV